MNVLVFSDSHAKIIDMFALVENISPDCVIHLGDYTDDAKTLELGFPNVKVYSVRGNNDYTSTKPLSSVITLENIKIYMTHGHMEGAIWDSYGDIYSHAKKLDCNIAFYGHTHCANHVTKNNIHIINPGSISFPRKGVASCFSLEIKGGKILNTAFLNAQGEYISI